MTNWETVLGKIFSNVLARPAGGPPHGSSTHARNDRELVCAILQLIAQDDVENFLGLAATIQGLTTVSCRNRAFVSVDMAGVTSIHPMPPNSDAVPGLLAVQCCPHSSVSAPHMVPWVPTVHVSSFLSYSWLNSFQELVLW